MKGFIFDIRSFSVHDGPGLRTTIFFKGCPLRCLWCHNPESWHLGIEKIRRKKTLNGKFFSVVEDIGYEITIDELITKISQDIPFFENSGGGITLSGGEPLMQPDFCKTILERAAKCEIHTALDTSGFASEKTFAAVAIHAKMILFDLKLFENQIHQQFTGQKNDVILKNLQWISQQQIPIIIRIPLIQNITDTDENLCFLQKLIEQTPHIERVDLLPYHYAARSKYENMNLDYSLINMESYPKEKAEIIKEKFKNVAPVVSLGA